jgi:hypothetical protein
MPGYLSHLEWLRLLWPLVFITGLTSLALWSAYRMATVHLLRPVPPGATSDAAPSTAGAAGRDSGTRKRTESRGEALFVIFGFSFLGVTIGWITGDSGAQVVASVLPAVLTLIGGLAVFLVGKQVQDSTMIAGAISGLTLMLLLGAFLSSENAREANTPDITTFQSQVESGTHLTTTEVDKLSEELSAQK